MVLRVVLRSENASRMPRMEDPSRGLPRKDDRGNGRTPLPSQVMGSAHRLAPYASRWTEACEAGAKADFGA